jgi:hypothetical protein
MTQKRRHRAMLKRRPFHALFVASLGLLLLVPAVAVAGKAEQAKRKQLEPVVAAAKANLKGSCGCAIDVSVDWASYRTADDMEYVDDAIQNLLSALSDNCDDDAEKRTVCKSLKGYRVTYQHDTGATLTKGTLVCGSNGDICCNQDDINNIVNAF